MLTSHIMSNVFSKPAIVVLMSRLGLLLNYVLTLDVISDTNYNEVSKRYYSLVDGDILVASL